MIRRLSLAVLAMSFLSASVGADDVRKVLFKTDAKLTSADPLDSQFKKSFQKVHQVKLDAGRLVRIEIITTDFAAYLRLEDAEGNVLAKTAKAHLIFKPQASEKYRLVVTTVQPEKTGEYILIVQEGTLVDERQGLLERAPKLLTMAGPARIEFLAEVRGYLKQRGDKIDLNDAVLTQITCKALERVSYDFAAVTFAEFMDLLAKTKDDKARKTA